MGFFVGLATQQLVAKARQPNSSLFAPAADSEPGLFSTVTHTVLDVAGLVPIIGEVADGANALYYLAEGNKVDAALSAAAMIPVAGTVMGAAKIVKKARKFKRFKQVWKSGVDLVEKGEAWAGKLQRGSTGFLGSPRLSRKQLQAYKKQAGQIGATLEIVKDKAMLKFMDAKKAQAGFQASVNKLFVRKGATGYEVTHELTHAKHCAELGKEAYKDLSRLEKETHVYETLMKDKHVLSSAEIEHATGYINGIRKEFGLNPLD